MYVQNKAAKKGYDVIFSRGHKCAHPIELIARIPFFPHIRAFPFSQNCAILNGESSLPIVAT